MPFYHCSKSQHPVGFVLTGNPDSPWVGVVQDYDASRTYVFEGDGDPTTLRDSAPFTNGAKYIYEVQPCGVRRFDGRGGRWTSWSYDSATITRLVWAMGD